MKFYETTTHEPWFADMLGMALLPGVGGWFKLKPHYHLWYHPLQRIAWPECCRDLLVVNDTCTAEQARTTWPEGEERLITWANSRPSCRWVSDSIVDFMDAKWNKPEKMFRTKVYDIELQTALGILFRQHHRRAANFKSGTDVKFFLPSVFPFLHIDERATVVVADEKFRVVNRQICGGLQHGLEAAQNWAGPGFNTYVVEHGIEKAKGGRYRHRFGKSLDGRDFEWCAYTF